MKQIIPGVALMILLFTNITAKAQTADDIVNKYIDAIGGKDIIMQVQSLYMEGSVQAMGNDNPTKVTMLSGKGYKTETEFNGMKMVQCITDKGGWAINPMNGGNAVAMPEEQYKSGKAQLDPGGELFDYAAKGSTVDLLGKDGNLFKLKLVTTDKSETTYFIDPATYFISKMVKKGNVMGQDVEITIQFTNYKKTDFGYVVPFTINTDLGQFQLATTITKAEVNKTIDPGIFAMPN